MSVGRGARGEKKKKTMPDRFARIVLVRVLPPLGSPLVFVIDTDGIIIVQKR